MLGFGCRVGPTKVGGRLMEKTGGAEFPDPDDTLRTSKMLFGRWPFDRLAAALINMLCRDALFGVGESSAGGEPAGFHRNFLIKIA